MAIGATRIRATNSYSHLRHERVVALRKNLTLATILRRQHAVIARGDYRKKRPGVNVTR
jgi:hypothetical protein